MKKGDHCLYRGQKFKILDAHTRVYQGITFTMLYLDNPKYNMQVNSLYVKKC